MAEYTEAEKVVLQDIQAQHAGRKLLAKRTGKGLVVLRLPEQSEVDTWQASKDSRRKCEDDLVAACCLYPSADVFKAYLTASPLLGTKLAEAVKAEALGMPEEEKADVPGIPADLTEQAALSADKKALGRDVWQVVTVKGRILLRLPHGAELDHFETSKRSARVSAEGLVIGCTLDPAPELVQTWFAEYALMPQWLSNKLRNYCVGEVEDLHSKP